MSGEVNKYIKIIHCYAHENVPHLDHFILKNSYAVSHKYQHYYVYKVKNMKKVTRVVYVKWRPLFIGYLGG